LVNGRRSQIEIITDILVISKDGAKKTDILYKGNFSYKQLQEYLLYMKDKDILEEIRVDGNGSRLYRPTKKGLIFLDDSKRLLEQLI